MRKKETYIYKIKVEKLDEGGFLAVCADVKDAFAEGNTVENAIENCQDVIRIILEYRKNKNNIYRILSFFKFRQSRMNLFKNFFLCHSECSGAE